MMTKEIMGMTLSIIVPIYNASTYLRACLDSIRNQNYSQWECYLVNDGSTDDSQLIIDEYCARDKRFISLIKKNEGSPALARQFAMKYVTSEFVCAIDADDLIDVDFVGKMLERQMDTDADVVIPRMLCFKDSVCHVEWNLPDEQFDLQQIISGKDAVKLTIPEWQIGFNGSLVKTDLMVRTSAGSLMNSDELKTREMLVLCRQVAFANTVYFYRANLESITKKLSPKIFDKTIIEALLVRFAKRYFPEDKRLVEHLDQKHFSGLQYCIVFFNSIKNNFSKYEIRHIEGVLKNSYKLRNVVLTLRRSLKWGMVVLLCNYSLYEKLVIRHFSKQVLK